MTKERTKLNPIMKPYQILILGCLLSSLLILNSNLENAQRSKDRSYRENNKFFQKISPIRRLDDGDSPAETSPSDKVCKLGTKELLEYYETGDLNKIGLDDGPIKSTERGEKYFDALINILKQGIGK